MNTHSNAEFRTNKQTKKILIILSKSCKIYSHQRATKIYSHQRATKIYSHQKLQKFSLIKKGCKNLISSRKLQNLLSTKGLRQPKTPLFLGKHGWTFDYLTSFNSYKENFVSHTDSKLKERTAVYALL